MPPARLGSILVLKGLLTVEQVHEVLQEQQAILGQNSSTDTAPRVIGEYPFGRALLREGLATEAELHECLRIQEQLARQGRVVRLGEIMVQQGYMTVADVHRALSRQQKAIYRCPVCKLQYNVWAVPPKGFRGALKAGTRLEIPPGRARCPSCQTPLEPFADCLTVKIEATIQIVMDMPRWGVATAVARVDPEISSDAIARSVGCFERAPNSTSLLFGRFEILGDLVRGTAGVTCKARDTRTQKLVGLKILCPELSPRQQDRLLFLEEARVLSELEHPNIVALDSVGVHRAYPFLATVYQEGIPLSTVIRMRKSLPGPEAALFLQDVTEAVQHCHQRGVLHGDLKPSNMLLTQATTASRAHAIVTDLGAARRIGEASDQPVRTILGTPAYMAPELAMGLPLPVDARTDVYSIGATLYEILTGSPPFQGPTPESIFERVRTVEIGSPSAVNPSVDPLIAAICLRAMARDRNRRYANADAMLAAVKTYIAGFGDVAARTTASPTPRPVK